ncbi:phosphate acetyltransferase [Fulvivirgaceae bacterium BMA12]|uniref:Phosphate acetyltransferase n=1 Tax=Agaribacillus aureus TaxID=3051825 RepID=A0ABT8L7N5_9BACT|nr:phosphate acetyltransferase [Fulvivirgaceae bacterium BMA12]
MNKSVYIATIEPYSGKSILVLGLMTMLLGKTARVGYFRPIIDDIPEGEIDNHINTVISHFDLKIDFETAYVYTRSEVLTKLNQGASGEIIDTIIRRYKEIEADFDFILVEGTDFSDDGSITEFDVNILIAKNLGIPVIIIAHGIGKSTDELVGSLGLACKTFKDKDVEVLSVFANKVSRDHVKEISSKLRNNLPEEVEVSIIPEIKSLLNPTLKEIQTQLDGKVLFGSDFLDNHAESFSVGAMQLRHYLPYVSDNSLVITPGDRADIILGALQANVSVNYPKISGIILTGGLVPEEPILKLIEGVSEVVPIISVEPGTFIIANKVGAIKSKIYAESKQKIATSITAFEKYVNTDMLAERLITFDSDKLTPRMFLYNLMIRAQQQKKHIVLPEGEDSRILKAVSRLIAADVVDITLIGDEEKIKNLSQKLNIPIDFDKLKVILPAETSYYEDYVDTFYELRKHKGMNHSMARDMMLDVSYFGSMMVYMGHADGMVSGAIHTTQHTIRPALQFIKTKPGASVVSSVFFMCMEDRVSVFGDCAINPNPNAEELAEIAIASADSSKAFGIEPKIAMLSYSSGASGKGEDVEKVRTATEIAKQKRPDLNIEGPIQYDAAVDARVGKSKLPDSKVAGQANVLIFPDLNTGNNTYKAVQRETGALAIGPMLQGLNKPVNDLSRGCTVEDVYNTVIITAIQAQQE